MGNNHKKPSLIPQSVTQKETGKKYLNKNVAVMEGWKAENPTLATVFISLRFVQESFQCFSAWSKQEMDVFWNFNRKIHDITWKDLIAQGGKAGNKTGFAPTIIPESNYPNKSFKDTLDPNTEFIELRANDKIRLHGFRDKSIFYICWLDKNHEICAS